MGLIDTLLHELKKKSNNNNWKSRLLYIFIIIETYKLQSSYKNYFQNKNIFLIFNFSLKQTILDSLSENIG